MIQCSEDEIGDGPRAGEAVREGGTARRGGIVTMTLIPSSA